MPKPDLSVKVRPLVQLTRADLVARERNAQEIVDHHQAVIRGLRDEVEKLKGCIRTLIKQIDIGHVLHVEGKQYHSSTITVESSKAAHALVGDKSYDELVEF